MPTKYKNLFKLSPEKAMAEYRKNLNQYKTTEFNSEAEKEGYPYRLIERDLTDGGRDISLTREVDTYSKIYNKKAGPDKTGGWQYGIVYKDGDTEFIDKKRFDAESAKWKEYKASKTPMYQSIKDNSNILKKVPKLNNGIDTSKLAQTGTQFIPGYGKFISAGIGAGQQIGDAIGDNEVGDFVKGITNPLSGVEALFNSDLSTKDKLLSQIPGVGGIIAGNARRDRERKELEARKEKEMAANQTRNIKTTNTQAPMYENGVSGSTSNKLVEVEKDEVVMRKDALGNYRVVADFKGGKDHNNGGEPYIMKEGDIVFPGKKRSTVMKHLKNGNKEALETERLKLPKDMPETEEYKCGTRHAKLQDGIDYTESEKQALQLRDKSYQELYDLWQSGKISEDEFNKRSDMVDKTLSGGIFDDWKMTAQPQQGIEVEDKSSTRYNLPDDLLNYSYDPSKSFNDMINRFDDAMQTVENSKPESLPAKKKSASEIWGDTYKVPETSKVDVKPETKDRSPIEVPLNDDPGILRDLSGLTGATLNASVDPNRFNLNADTSIANTSESKGVFDDVKKEKDAEQIIKGGGTMGDVLAYIPAATNILNGMFSKPEKVQRRFVRPETIQYQDMSDPLREQSARQQRIDEANAVRFSGGSGQSARAGKALAGAQNIGRQSAIDAQEVARANQIESANVDIRNKAQAQNVQLSNRYDELDAMNRAAIDAYFDQGVSDFGRIAKQKRLDKKMETQQDMILKNLRSNNFGAGSAGDVGFLG